MTVHANHCICCIPRYVLYVYCIRPLFGFELWRHLHNVSILDLARNNLALVCRLVQSATDARQAIPA